MGLEFLSAMAIWGISDLHLALSSDPEGTRLGPRWLEHRTKIEKNWRRKVQDEDLVLIPGDISMARKHKDVQPDLRWLHELPGKKALSPGNHDQWWNQLAKVRVLMRDTQIALEGDAVETHSVIVCGAWSAPPIEVNSARDPRETLLIQRGLKSLETALIRANVLRTNRERIYVLWHHPPFDSYGRPGPCVQMFEDFRVNVCVYGHIHAESQWSTAVRGTLHGVRYQCVAADSIGFSPLLIAD